MTKYETNIWEEMMKCEKCAWAIWDYAGVVACCNDGPCPSEEDFEEAKKEGGLAV